jgi:hypothetical protein
VRRTDEAVSPSISFSTWRACISLRICSGGNEFANSTVGAVGRADYGDRLALADTKSPSAQLARVQHCATGAVQRLFGDTLTAYFVDQPATVSELNPRHATYAIDALAHSRLTRRARSRRSLESSSSSPPKRERKSIDFPSAVLARFADVTSDIECCPLNYCRSAGLQRPELFDHCVTLGTSLAR